MQDPAALHAEIAMLKQALARATASLQDTSDALAAQTAACEALRRGNPIGAALLQGLPDVPMRIAERRGAAQAQTQAHSQAVSSAQDDFLAMLNHELRNPLNAIATAVEVLNRTDAPTAAAVNARRIISMQTRQLAGMLDRLLDAGRILADTIVLQRQPLDFSDCVRRAAVGAQADAEAKGQRLQTISRTATEVWVHADAGRLRQVLELLLGNAVKTTPAAGGIALELELVQDGSTARLRVTHSGRMETALLERIFDPSAQGQRSPARQDGALGIGLTAVRRLVELHGGSVRARTDEGGTVFELRLPVIAAPGAASPAAR